MTINNTLQKIIRKLKYYYWMVLSKTYPAWVRSFKINDHVRFDYPINSVLGSGLFIGNFEHNEINFFGDNIKTGDTVFDIGANGGLYTIIAAHKVGPNGHVYAFEPGTKELDLLRHNIQKNKLSNVTIVDKVICDKVGTTKFGISKDGAMNSILETDHPSQDIERWEEIESITIDSFIHSNNIKKVNFIKIDVEGAESLVFNGIKTSFQVIKDAIFLFESSELNSSYLDCRVKDLIKNVGNMGFNIYYLSDEGELTNVEENNPELGYKIYNFIASSNEF